MNSNLLANTRFAQCGTRVEQSRLLGSQSEIPSKLRYQQAVVPTVLPHGVETQLQQFPVEPRWRRKPNMTATTDSTGDSR